MATTLFMPLAFAITDSGSGSWLCTRMSGEYSGGLNSPGRGIATSASAGEVVGLSLVLAAEGFAPLAGEPPQPASTRAAVSAMAQPAARTLIRPPR